jgi:hypothetical protein
VANATEYGLAGAVFSADEARCERVTRKLRVGIMWKNCCQPAFIQAPWGGVKARCRYSYHAYAHHGDHLNFSTTNSCMYVCMYMHMYVLMYTRFVDKTNLYYMPYKSASFAY